MSFGVKFKGMPSLRRTLIKKAAQIKEVDKVLGKGAFKVERDTKKSPNMPVDTAALRNSIHTQKIKALNWKVADGVNYGKYQEFGTTRVRGKHFMQGAFKKNIKEIIRDVKNVYD